MLVDEKYRQKMEPGSAPYQSRIDSLKFLHDNGFKTWVSIEHYPTPNIVSQDILNILKTIGFVDKIIFGRTNYSKEVSSYSGCKDFYNSCTEQIIEFCELRKISYHIKTGTMTGYFLSDS